MRRIIALEAFEHSNVNPEVLNASKPDVFDYILDFHNARIPI